MRSTEIGAHGQLILAKSTLLRYLNLNPRGGTL